MVTIIMQVLTLVCVCTFDRGREFMINAIEDEIDRWESSSSDSLHRFGEFVLGLQTSAVVIPIFIILW